MGLYPLILPYEPNRRETARLPVKVLLMYSPVTLSRTQYIMKSQKQKQKSAVRRPSIRGRGDYAPEVVMMKKPMERLEAKIDHLEKSLVKNPLSKAHAASTIGRTLGNFVGQGDLGALAGSTLSKYFGHGDYSVKHNSLMLGDKGTMAGAKFSNDGKRGTRIMEREYIGDIVAGALSGSSTIFSASTYNLNPTDSATFPWLSQIAHLYDQWEPNGIVFEFVSTSSEYNGSSQALGTVIMATEYDPYDSSFADKQTMENADYSCSTKPAHGLLHGIECAPKERTTSLLYTSTDNGAPLFASTLGKFVLATQGCSVAGVNLGELWISYDITFYKKQLEGNLSSSLPHLNATGTTTVSTGFFAAPTIITSKTITLTQNVGVGSVLNFNNSKTGGKYAVNYVMSIQSTNDVLSNWTGFNCTLKRELINGNGTAGIICWIVTTTGPNATFTTSVKPGATASSYALYASQIAIAPYTWGP